MPTSPPKSYEDYTVGWICALPKEQTAALSMLDARHPDLPKSPRDANVYALGSIGLHNIAVTCLPMKCYGTNQAARAAAQMLSTFPSIKIGLMVGIGAGVPPKVSLGDVVISTEWTQWDFGKANKNGIFEHSDKRHYPPDELLSAISRLQSEHDIHGTKMQQYLNDFRVKNPDLVSRYTKIEGSEYDDEDGNEDATSRLGDPDKARIHYGLIASGNQVVKDAQLRDSINKRLKNEVLCIEMEAAGLIGFPAVVIRGICDYADSTKADDWQEYAAVRAAICAKELLECVQPCNTVRSNEELKQILAEIAILRHSLTKEEDRDMLNWLTAIDYSTQQNDFLNRRQSGTGEWLLNSPEYQTWLNESQILFCPGIPGAGKTIITSIVIDNLTDRYSYNPSIGIAYIYFNFKGSAQLHIDDLVLSLLKQLSIYQPFLPGRVKEICSLCKSSRQPLRKSVLAALHDVIALYSRVFIVVDALDECRWDLFIFLEELFDMHRNHGINIFATSRHIPEIQSRFPNNSIMLEIRASDEDVKTYLEGQITQVGTKVLKNNKEMIKQAISQAAQGMFLLAQLYLESIKSKPTLKKIKLALSSLVSGEKAYDRAYQDAMDRITENCDAELKNMAYQVLSWITCAFRPLTKGELQHAIAMELDESEIEEYEPGEQEFDEDNIPEIEDIVSLCCGLVTVDEESDIVRLVHYTTQEYFERSRPFWFPQAHSDIAKISIIYISLKEFETGPSDSRPEYEERLQKSVLYDYSANNWGHHARESSTENISSTNKPNREAFWFTRRMELVPLVLKFLQKTNLRSGCVQAIFSDPAPGSSLSQHFPKDVLGIHLAAYFGLTTIISELIMDEGVDLKVADSGDVYGRKGLTPLSWASEGGNQAAVKLLLNYETRPEHRAKVLLWAANSGNEEMVELLLTDEKSVDLEGGGSDETPLLLAAECGHGKIARLLLEKGADFNARCEYDGRSVLIHAINNRDDELAKLLIEKGANLEDRDWEHGMSETPLLLVVGQGNESLVKLLLDYGADLAVTDQEYRKSPLSWAVVHGYERIVELLLNKGAALGSRDYHGRTPLSDAAVSGHAGIVQLLLDKGADIESKDEDGRTPLSWAAEGGTVEVVKLLLQNGADSETRDNKTSSTPLRWAVKGRQEKIVKLLVEKVSHFQPNDSLSKILIWSAGKGHDWVVQQAQEKGWDLEDPKKFFFRTMLFWAAEKERLEILTFIKERGLCL